jgi:hypothetical protein
MHQPVAQSDKNNKPIKFKNMKQINQLRQTIVNRSKKAALIMALLLTVVTGATFANGINMGDGSNNANTAPSANGVNRPVSASFKQDFKNAQFISSEAHSNFTKLTFRMNDMILSAFYAENGKLIAVVRNILSSQLPINLMMDLKKNYSDYWITELFELNEKGQNCYYVSLENADSKLVLRSNDNVTWDVYQQTDKN